MSVGMTDGPTVHDVAVLDVEGARRERVTAVADRVRRMTVADRGGVVFERREACEDALAEIMLSDPGSPVIGVTALVAAADTDNPFAGPPTAAVGEAVVAVSNGADDVVDPLVSHAETTTADGEPAVDPLRAAIRATEWADHMGLAAILGGMVADDPALGPRLPAAALRARQQVRRPDARERHPRSAPQSPPVPSTRARRCRTSLMSPGRRRCTTATWPLRRSARRR